MRLGGGGLCGSVSESGALEYTGGQQLFPALVLLLECPFMREVHVVGALLRIESNTERGFDRILLLAGLGLLLWHRSCLPCRSTGFIKLSVCFVYGGSSEAELCATCCFLTG